MRDLDVRLVRLWRRARLAARYAAAIIVATVLGGTVFLGVFHLMGLAGLTDVEFARGLALGIGAEGRRQYVGLIGLGVTLLGFLVFVALHAALVEPRFGRTGRRASTWVRAIPMNVATLLLWGVMLQPEGLEGFLGLSGGIGTTIALVVAVLASCASAVRAYSLMITSEWWQPKEVRLGEALVEELGVQQRGEQADAEADEQATDQER